MAINADVGHDVRDFQTADENEVFLPPLGATIQTGGSDRQTSRAVVPPRVSTTIVSCFGSGDNKSSVRIASRRSTGSPRVELIRTSLTGPVAVAR
jgi:hypothetical protein